MKRVGGGLLVQTSDLFDVAELRVATMHIWQKLTENAQSVEEVLDIAQDYIASLTPADLFTVPEECRPIRIRDESDIDFWNLRLAEECRAVWGTDRDGKLLTQLSQFFMCASVRLSRLNEGRELPGAPEGSTERRAPENT